MLVKVIGTLILGGGVGIPLSSTLKKTILSEKIPNIMRTADAVVRLEWNEENLRQSIGQIIDNLGEKVKVEKNGVNGKNNKKAKVLVVRLTTKGVFNEKICEELGFNPGLVEPPPVSAVANQDISEYTKGIGCYTNLDI